MTVSTPFRAHRRICSFSTARGRLELILRRVTVPRKAHQACGGGRMLTLQAAHDLCVIPPLAVRCVSLRLWSQHHRAAISNRDKCDVCRSREPSRAEFYVTPRSDLFNEYTLYNRYT